MNLVAMINGRNIAGYQESALKEILRGNHPVSVRMAQNGMVMLSDNTIVKCVHEYYQNPDSTMDMKKYKNSPAKCHYVQENLGINGVPLNRCGACHLMCMQMREDKELRRIYR